MNYIPQDCNVIFQEVPGEISLSFSITGCGLHCIDCHSPYLQSVENGELLTWDVIDKKLAEYKSYISCVLFMGGDKYENVMFDFLMRIKKIELKTAMYSGHEDIPHNLKLYLDYYKVGCYNPSFGGLDCESTNQRFYAKKNGAWLDKTAQFWKE